MGRNLNFLSVGLAALLAGAPADAKPRSPKPLTSEAQIKPKEPILPSLAEAKEGQEVTLQVFAALVEQVAQHMKKLGVAEQTEKGLKKKLSKTEMSKFYSAAVAWQQEIETLSIFRIVGVGSGQRLDEALEDFINNTQTSGGDKKIATKALATYSYLQRLDGDIGLVLDMP